MIKQKKKVCEGCNTEQILWKGKKCKSCSFKENPPKAIKKYSEKGLEKKKLKTETTKKLHQWFLDLWDKRADKNGNVRCFETDITMSHTIYKENICCYSHQIPKSKRPDLAFKEDNLLIVLPDVHASWEANQENCPKMYEYTKKLKKKYEILH